MAGRVRRIKLQESSRTFHFELPENGSIHLVSLASCSMVSSKGKIDVVQDLKWELGATGFAA